MSDLVTLSCPTCGGKLEITSSINRFACSHCGNEHIVRREGGVIALEAVGKRTTCPIENHDDMVQKVSAIVSGQTFSVTVMTQESYTYTDSEGRTRVRTRTVPREGTQVSRLAQKLAPPLEPSEPSKLGDYMTWLACVLAPFEIWGCISMFLGSYAQVPRNRPLGGSSMHPTAMFIIVVGFIACIFAVPFILRLFYKPKFPKLETEYQAKYADWLQVKSKWDNCYYCHRHDVVFVAGSTEASPPDDFQSFLYSQ